MKCIIIGCNNNRVSTGRSWNGKKRLYKKLCSSHHKKKYGIPILTVRQRKRRDVVHMAKWPCKRCGWSNSYCDLHRIIMGRDGGEYKLGNVVPLCPNCHRIEHEGDFGH